MTSTNFHNSLRRYLKDQGLAFVAPTYEWSPEELTLRAQSARDTVYTRLVEAGAVAAVSRLIKTCVATDGTNVPADFWQGIMGYRGATSTGAYVLFQDPALSLAMGPGGLDTVYVVGGVFKGTADTAFYYARPQDDLSPNGGTFTEFSNGVMNAIALLTVIEITMGEVQDAADRLDDLYEIYLPYEQSFE
jgi:hypothetical protein